MGWVGVPKAKLVSKPNPQNSLPLPIRGKDNFQTASIAHLLSSHGRGLFLTTCCKERKVSGVSVRVSEIKNFK
jgi:hypothetical protein